MEDPEIWVFRLKTKAEGSPCLHSSSGPSLRNQSCVCHKKEVTVQLAFLDVFFVILQFIFLELFIVCVAPSGFLPIFTISMQRNV